MTAIQVDGLTKVYRGGIKAVNAISFAVEQGEVFGLLGPNGAGKSTVMQILTTLALPSAGRPLVWASTRFDAPTGRENLSLQARFYGIPSVEISSGGRGPAYIRRRFLR